MDALFDRGGIWIKLHGVAFHALDGASMSGEFDVRDNGEHGVREILHHERHPMRLGPAEAEQRASLSFASLQGDTTPAKTTTEADEFPVVRAFIKEERLACRDAADVDLMRLQIIREGLLDIECAGIDLRLISQQTVGDGIDVGGVFDRAVEVGTEPAHAIGKADATDADVGDKAVTSTPMPT